MATVNRPTALFLSVLLHASLMTAGLLVWPFAHREQLHVTPVTLMTAAEAAPLRAAEEAPAPQEAQVEKPEPAPAKEQPQPAPPPPPPQPPGPPQPVPKAADKAKPVAKSQPLDLNNLARSLAQAAPPAPAPKAAARPGPTQAERDEQARKAEGELRAATANALQAIGNKIADNWNLPCANPDDRRVVVVLRIELGINGGLIAVKPEGYASVETIPDPRVRAAAFSALAAARAAEPFNGLPQQTYADWRSKTYEFRASEVCADRMRMR
jgi:outer membrane biosynthesis protein TonB